MRWKTCWILTAAGLCAGYCGKRSLQILERDIGRGMMAPLLPGVGKGEGGASPGAEKVQPIS
ncbi:MAG: hypothetical protein WDA20_05190 [Desulfuromonadales bacterium]